MKSVSKRVSLEPLSFEGAVAELLATPPPSEETASDKDATTSTKKHKADAGTGRRRAGARPASRRERLIFIFPRLRLGLFCVSDGVD